MSALDRRRALVTGAANGIGKAIAAALAMEGATVLGLDIQTGPGGDAAILRCDLTREEQIVSAVAEAAARLGGIDILVNNAGILREGPLADTTAELVDLHFAVNVRGTILVTREALPHLGAGARIINIASELAYLGRQNASVYAASKAAILGLTRSWARELGPHVLVNAVAPGPTDTALLGFDAMSDEQRSLETANPLGRIGRPDEVAAAVVFLAGDGATLFTGQCLGANGGAAMS